MRALALTLLAATSLAAAPARAQDTAPPAEASAEVRAFLKTWAERMEGVKTLRVEFTQTKKLRILRRPFVSQGYTLLKGKRVLMVVFGKDGKRQTELLVEPDAVRMHYPRLRKVEVYPAVDGAPRSPFVLFGEDLEALPETHRLRLEAAEEGEHVLLMVPKDAASKERETRVRLRDYVVVELRQVTKKGDEVILAVSKFEKNAPVKDEELTLSVTEDTKTVEVVPGRKKD